MDESFSSRWLAAGAVGIAGGTWGLSNLTMVVFSDSGSLISGLSLSKVPGGGRGRTVGNLERAGSLEIEAWGAE